MPNDRTTALYFDLDGTLIHSHGVWNIAMAEALCKVDPTLPLFELERIWEARRATGFTFCWQDTWEDRSPRGAAFWDAMNPRFLRVYAELGIDAHTAEAALPHIRAHILDPQNYHLYPDTLAVLEACKARGIPCVMISNNYPETVETCAALGLTPYFRGYAISGDIGLDKPHRAIFDYAMSLCPECSRHIMVGDNIHADIGGGKAAGMETVYVHRGEHPDADHCFDSLLPILDLI